LDTYGIGMTLERIQDLLFTQVPNLFTPLIMISSYDPFTFYLYFHPRPGLPGTHLDLIIDPPNVTNPAILPPLDGRHAPSQPIIQFRYRRLFPFLNQRYRVPNPGYPIIPSGQTEIFPTGCGVGNREGIDGAVVCGEFTQFLTRGEGG